VNLQAYVDIIECHFLPLATALYGDAEFILQQDNAPSHTSAFTRQALAEHGLQLLEWPPNSPDMNCIENIWGILKRKLRSRGTGETRAEVIAHAIHIWETDPDLRRACINCIQSMPARLHALYIARGGVIRY
jgi:hypothetical protein